MKNSLFIFAFSFILIMTNCHDPFMDESVLLVYNSTDASITYKGFADGIQWRNQLLEPKDNTGGDGGGQLTYDSVRFVTNYDSITYINPHFDSIHYQAHKNRSFYNIENWIKTGNDYIYTIYESDFK